MMRYGLPYKGSKNKIAEWVVDTLPATDTLVDLFAGGCAITHCAMLSGKWQKFIVNDIEADVTQLFLDAIHGKYRDEDKWISRDMFYLLKDTDPYIRYCWSFGNNGREYLYGKEIERFKVHLHHMFFSKTPKETRLHWKAFVREFAKVKEEINELTAKVEALCDECGIAVIRKADGTIDANHIKSTVEKVMAKGIREYMRDALKKSGRTVADVDRLLGTQMAGHYFGESQWALPTEEAYQKMQTIIPGLDIPWPSLKARLESLERLQSLESLERLERLQSLQSFNLDYQQVPIPDNATIYCDIPYRNTDGYQEGGFNHERFYDWAAKQKNIYISEYWMPEDRFEVVAERKKRSTLSSASNSKVTIEKIYKPR